MGLVNRMSCVLHASTKAWAAVSSQMANMVRLLVSLSCFAPAFVVGLVTMQRPPAPAFVIDLTVQAGKASKTAHAVRLGQGFAPKERSVVRPVLEAKAGQPILVRWTLTRSAGQPALKGIIVHFFVTPEEKVGQAVAAKKNNPVESALTMDFKASDKAQGELRITLDQPGAYLLKLETIGAGDTDGRESFAALDLVLR
jgi:hypothetical protein